MLHRGTCPFDRTMTIHKVIKVSMDQMRSGVVLVSNFFLGLHVPRVKKTPSFGFFGDGLLLCEV